MRSKPDLLPESYPEIERLLKVLKDNPAIKIELAGHTDNVGKASRNESLSQRRAKAVKAYLIKKGIAANRMSAKGFGEMKPYANNKYIGGRAKNRRVELKLGYSDK